MDITRLPDAPHEDLRSRGWRVLRSPALAVVVLALTGCGTGAAVIVPDAAGQRPAPTPSWAPTPIPTAAAPTPIPTPTPTRYVAVIDGDTILTSEGTVRIIGIDTPEAGECGHDEASMAIGRLLSPGDPVTLELPPRQNDVDRYGRLVRHVMTSSGVDLGLVQLEAGNAVARYDSTDGYPWHPREEAYRAAQVAQLGPDGSVVTTACQGGPPSGVAPFTEVPEGEFWWTKYSSCAKLKKNTVGDLTGPFRRDDPAEAAIYAWFAFGTGNRGDGDGDGMACE